jgi:hypothetical protein
MTAPSSSTAPLPNPQGKYVYTPKITGQTAITRQEISQYSSTKIGLQVVSDQNNVDPDDISVTIYQKTAFTSTDDPLGPGLTYGVSDIDREDVGVYSIILDNSYTQDLSLIAANWKYILLGKTYQYWDYFEVLQPMPTYDAMSDGEKGVIRLVSNMFEDLYDSVDGGPHLKEEFQTHFGTETIARCMELACHRINSTSQPYKNFNVGAGVGEKFPEAYYSILVMGTYLEVVRHLIRSYTEYPVMQGGPGVSFVDRSAYVDRWRAILQDEADDFKRAVRSFKRSFLGLGGGSLLVAGGIYGAMNRFKPGGWAMAARGTRFMYPIAMVAVAP